MPAILRHRLGAVQHVFECRDADAVGMGGLLRLLELLRIAEQHEAVGRLRHGERIGQRHLPGLVDEQHVDGSPRTRGATRATLSRRGRPRRVASAARASSLSGISRTLARSSSLRLVHLGARAARVSPERVACSDDGISRLRITLWEFAVTPTLRPARRARESSARRRRSCPRRAVPESASVVRSSTVAIRTAKSVSGSFDSDCELPRRAVAAGPAATGRCRSRAEVPSMKRSASASPTPAATVPGTTSDANTAVGCTSATDGAFSNVDRPRVAIVRHDFAEGAGRPAAAACRPDADLDVLRRISVAIDRPSRSACPFSCARPLQRGPRSCRPAMASRFVEQILFRQVLQAEVLPPLGVVLAAVPVDEIREQPARVVRMGGSARPLVAGRRAAARAARRPASAAPRHRRGAARHPRRGPRHIAAAGDGFGRAAARASRAGPRRAAVVLVVALDGIANLARNGLGRTRPRAPAPRPCSGCATSVKRDAPRKAVIAARAA